MFSRDELALIWFDYNDLTFLKVEKILREFNHIGDIFDKNLIKNANFAKIGLEEVKAKLLDVEEKLFEEKIENEFYKHNISAVTFASKDYPEKLKTIDSPPLVLYVRGDTKLLGKKSIAIVGTRKPTTYGRIVCEKFTRELSSAGLVTVSGLAYGIDTVVAETTLEVGGKTIAVLAGGLDSIYPSQNKALSKRVEGNGLLVSEQRIGVKPANYMFVNRNRIVSALSLGTLIVEAGKNSGTMTTARHAIEQSRELFVVPGNIYSFQSEGTNNLIDEMPETFTISPERILFKLKIKKRKIEESAVQVDLVQNKILSELEKEELTFDELSDRTGIKPAELSSELIKMEMFGLVRKGSSNTYFKM
ncbi:MAG: DNA-processing protein DprA [Clostridia bacterium]|nr:DNA-processing protein DprA [Clostridia bacterium]